MVENEMDNPDERRRMARQSKFHYYRDNVSSISDIIDLFLQTKERDMKWDETWKPLHNREG